MAELNFDRFSNQQEKHMMENNGDAIKIKPLSETKNRHRSQSLIEEAYRKIKEMILKQKIVPGQRLINRDLCNILNMSRTPIVNALNRLVQDGFVGWENFRGFYVRPIDLQEVWDAFGVREALEVYAVEQAIKSGDAEGMETLEEKRREHQHYIPHYYTSNKFLLDSEFHLQIAVMAKNRVLKWLLKRNFEHIFLRVRLDNYDLNRMPSSANEHRRLVERMKKKDVLGSVEIIRNHVQIARDQVIRCLTSDESEEVKFGES